LLTALKTRQPPLSSARAALADHLATIAAQAGAAERLRRPVDVLKARIEAAETAQREARAECSRLIDEHANALSAWASDGGKGSEPAARELERTAAIAKAESAIQALDAARKALAEVETPLEEAQKKLAKLHADTPGTVLSVMAELADDALETLEAVRRDAAAADARVRGLIRLLKEQAELKRKDAAPETAAVLFRLVEQINGKFDKLKPAAPTNAEVGDDQKRWVRLMDQLAGGDAMAQIE